MKSTNDKQNSKKSNLRVGIITPFNFTLLSETQMAQIRAIKDGNQSEFAAREFGDKFTSFTNSHAQKLFLSVFEKRQICQELLRLVDSIQSERFDDKAIQATKEALSIEKGVYGEILNNFAPFATTLSKMEMLYGGRHAIAKKSGVKSIDEVQKAVYQKAEELHNARQTGNTKLESVLKTELQALEARLDFMREK